MPNTTKMRAPKRPYTGVGSRETPPDVMRWLTALGEYLAQAGYCLRSGGARGADTAFETGARKVAGSCMEIYLPWEKFENNPSKLFSVDEAAFQLAKNTHPQWQKLGQGGQKMHARNCYQVLGADLISPSEFLICWSEDGCEAEHERTKDTGGTGTAIVLALRNNVPVFNLGRPETPRRLIGFLKERNIKYPASMAISPIAGQVSLFN